MEGRQRTKIAPKDRTPYQQYTLTAWGDSPWPDLNSPSAAECEEVYNRLMAAHGKRLRPAHITAPSLEVAGCGEVPQVLDAIVRTMISANTKFEYADAALQKLISEVGVILDNKKFNTAEHPELQHCLDYNYIRTSMTQVELQEAIAKAGNQKVTARRILTMLADVYGKNKERADAFRNETPEHPVDPAKFLAANIMSDQEKQWEIKMFENRVLHLEFLKKLTPEHAMNEMLLWEGIGVKTAACVLMFCMQEDVLACDTHCIRLSKWLGWVPIEAKDELVFAHVDNKVPNHLKYALHQLFIQHGKDCNHCKDDKDNTKVASVETICPLEDLLDRGPLKALKTAAKAKAEAKRAGTPSKLHGKAKGKAKDNTVVAKTELQSKAEDTTEDKARVGVKTRAKGKAKIKVEEDPDEKVEESTSDVEGEAIIKDMAPVTNKRTRASAKDDEGDYAPTKRTRTTKTQPPATARRTRAQTRAEREKE